MSISKRFQTTGAVGGHGMQEIDVNRVLLEEKYHEEAEKDCKIICGNGCGEFTVLGEKLSIREQILLGDHIHATGQCPFCSKDENGKIDFEYCVQNQSKMTRVTFTMNDQRYDTIYKPEGYKFLPPQEKEEE